MALRFFLGQPGSGKSYRLFRHIIDESTAHPEQNFLIIVPEQFSFATQSELVRLHPRGGILNIDVLSLNRLAYRIFDETGANTHELLEESGKSIVLRRISLENKKEMPYLGRHLSRPGSIAAVKSVLSELMQYNISEEQLLTGASSVTPELRRKLTDIAALLSEYKAYCSEHFMNMEEVPSFLAAKVSSSSFLKNCTVAFDGFTGFTPVQLPVLRELMIHARNVYVTATIDESYAQSGDNSPDLFSMSRAMIASLYNLAAENKVRTLPPVFVKETRESRLSASPALSHIGAVLFRNKGFRKERNTAGIELFSGENPSEEVRCAARRIRRMLREDGLRCRDIAVICGELPLYGDLARRIFPEYDIPFFIDEKRMLLMHPYIEFLRGAMQIFTEGWTYDAVFRFLRTDLTDIAEEDIDLLENYVLALGIRTKKRWTEPWHLLYRGMDETRLLYLNELREKVVSILLEAHESFVPSSGTAREKTTVLYTLSTACNVQQKLRNEEDRLRERGELALAGEYAQIYGIVMRLFDKMVDILGDHKVTAKDYRALLEAALAESRIGITPPTGDAVTVGDVERSRLNNVKALFFLGVNDGTIPHPARENGILTEADKAALASCGIELSPLPEDELAQQRFYLYLALTKPSQKLILSYARTDMNGAALKPSFLIREVSRLFSGLFVTHMQRTPLPEIETPPDGMHELPYLLSDTLQDDEKQAVLELYRSLLLTDPDDPRYTLIPEAAGMRKIPENLSMETAALLYGKTLRNSVTRLENFAACAFSHFVSYGLRLRERETFTYSGMDRGNILHEALENYAAEIRSSGRLWQDVPEEERNALCDRCIENTASVYSGRLLYDTAASEYEIDRLKRMMRRTVRALTAQLSRGDFVPSGFEVEFRETERLPLTELDPDGSLAMILNGKIDRIDICKSDDTVLVKIIDYKSGTSKFNLYRIYEGLQLQLLTYLNAALSLTEKNTGLPARPAGIFYYNIDDPVIDVDPGASEETKEEALLDKLKPNGVLSGDADVIRHLDRGLGTSYRKSSVIPAGLTVKGAPLKGSGIIPEENFRLLTRFASRKAAEIACRILSGEADVSPYRISQENACTYCPYLGICGLDRRIPGYGFRDLTEIKGEEIWKIFAGNGAAAEETAGAAKETGAGKITSAGKEDSDAVDK